MIPDFGEIQRLVSQGRYEFSIHAERERLAEDLDVVELELAIGNGEILEEYPDDTRGWSCLMLGYAGAKPIHLVIGWAGSMGQNFGILRIITVYLPNPPWWRTPRDRGERV
jgi:hypothetical protein